MPTRTATTVQSTAKLVCDPPPVTEWETAWLRGKCVAEREMRGGGGKLHDGGQHSPTRSMHCVQRDLHDREFLDSCLADHVQSIWAEEWVVKFDRRRQISLVPPSNTYSPYPEMRNYQNRHDLSAHHDLCLR